MKINNNFVFFDLKRSPAEWAQQMDEMLKNSEREDPEQIERNFTEKGFNIKTEVQKLESVME